MLDFKELIEVTDKEKLNYVITTEGNPVWDYKIGALNTIFLISNIQDGLEEEYVTVGELRRFIVSSEIPFELVKIKTEEHRLNLLSYEWKNSNKELTLSR